MSNKNDTDVDDVSLIIRIAHVVGRVGLAMAGAMSTAEIGISADGIWVYLSTIWSHLPAENRHIDHRYYRTDRLQTDKHCI